MGLGDLFYPYGFVLQALALIHFFRRRPDGFWFFVILFFGALGALIYFIAEVVPDFDMLRAHFRRAGRKRRRGNPPGTPRERARGAEFDRHDPDKRARCGH
jgi:hypothetical protein